MIVYGDPQYAISRLEARGRVLEYFERAFTGKVDAARDLVIALGQVEQAIADDSSSERRVISAAMRASDLAAEHFVSLHLSKGPGNEVLRTARECALQSLGNGAGELHIKIPEGFAFYSLFPEQYILASLEYARLNSRERTLVAGIRTIGTSLSSVVKATLLADGFPAERITVRPTGHPFERKTELPAALDSASVIVVDEGPGLSGSSMASVAIAFRERGWKKITFFPSHRNKPGAAASEEVARIWDETATIVHPMFNGDPGQSAGFRALKSATERICGAAVAEIDELSAGKWVKILHPRDGVYPAPAFERTKFRLRCANGRTLLWKFAGLGPGRELRSYTAEARSRQQKLATRGWCAPVVEEECGFMATEWIDGRAAHASDLNDKVAAHLAAYIEGIAQPPLCENEIIAALERLSTMVDCNFREAGLENLISGVFANVPKPSELNALPSYGDGRVAPHEFIWRDGRLLKTDVWGHENDHTIVGPQPILWDVAGAIVEWRMNDASIFLQAFPANVTSDREALRFYVAACLAFRIGVCSFAGNSEGVEFYKAAAWRCLRAG